MANVIADDLVDPGMYVKVVEMAKNNYYGVLPGWKPENYFPGGYLRLRTDGSVEGIDEKPGPGNEPSEYVNIGGHYIADAKDFFIQLKNTKSEKDDVYEKTLTELMKHNSFGVVSYEGKMASLKYPWHVLSITEQLLSTLQGHISKTASVDKTAKIDGNVFLSDGVRVFENAKITGPCYIGPNTIVGNGTMVRHSIIEHDSVLGYNSDIARSYIGSNTWLHSNYVGDSVIASNVGFGSGAVTANLRLDEEIIQSRVKGEKISTNRNKLGAVIGEGVRIGVQVSTMPGIKIGARSVIGPGVVVNADIPADTKVMLKQEVTMLSATSTVDSTNRQGFKDKI
jgi:bifunctional UDP-N-acetylglucosamine pyrophosphorylase/glucosamine-1-phosphate N-acetyltransferase